MDAATVIRVGWKYLEGAGVAQDSINTSNFLDWSEKVRDVLNEFPAKRLRDPTMRDFALSLRTLRDNFDKVVEADPMCIYRPLHDVSLAFHKSSARVRYFHAGTRSSKTQSGIAEDHWFATGSHPYRKQTPYPRAIAVIGPQFTKYASSVFEPKFLSGEQGNPYSPAYPEGGKWFYSYNRKTYTIELACPNCAEAGRAGSCSHLKTRISLFSDMEGPEVFAGAQYAMVHIDEHVDYELYREGRDRIKTVPHSSLIITESPRKGRSFWTWGVVAALADSGEKIPGSDTPIAERFNISQFDAGLVDHNEIKASMKDMTENEITWRIYGMPAVDSEKAVFDPVAMLAMHDDIREGVLGSLAVDTDGVDTQRTQEEELIHATPETRIHFTKEAHGLLTVFEPPQAGCQYVVGVDVAHGLTKRDASCAEVLKMTPVGTQLILEEVAQYHGWINPLEYAVELFKLCLFYAPNQNPAQLVIERNGPGMSLIQRLNELQCWFMFQDISSAAAVKFMLEQQYGIDTNVRSKSIIIASLQDTIRAKRLNKPSVTVRSMATLGELENYVQEATQSGLTYRFQAEGSGNDDRVMALALAVYAAKAHQLFDFQLKESLIVPGGQTNWQLKDFWDKVHSDLDDERQRTDDMESPYDLDV